MCHVWPCVTGHSFCFVDGPPAAAAAAAVGFMYCKYLCRKGSELKDYTKEIMLLYLHIFN